MKYLYSLLTSYFHHFTLSESPKGELENQQLKSRYLREQRWFKGSLDDSSIHGQYGANNAGQKNQCQLIDVLHTYKHHHGHEGQHQRAIHSHVIQHGCLCFWPLQILHLKDGSLWHDVDLTEEPRVKECQRDSGYKKEVRRKNKLNSKMYMV